MTTVDQSGGPDQPLLARYRRPVIFVSELAVVLLSLAAAFQLRFEFEVPPHQRALFLQGLGLALLAKLAVFRLSGLERRSFRFTSFADIWLLAGANLAGSALFTICTRVVVGPRFPRSIYLVDFLLCFLGLAAGRVLVRYWWERKQRRLETPGAKRILIYGAGRAGVALLRHLEAVADRSIEPVGFVDDDTVKRGAILHGLAVLGSGGSIKELVSAHSVDEVWIAIPSASEQQLERAAEHCRAAGTSHRRIPKLAELVTGAAGVGQLQNVGSETLIGRQPVELHQARLRSWIAGRRVLITGAGGSIGSELCRQIASSNPQALILMDHNEDALYSAETQLRREFPEVALDAVLADTANADGMARLIRRCGVTLVLHAAAHKHVPLMERQPIEAVANNVLGTYRLLSVARELGVPRFVLISSDKAVYPSSVMGATKRLAELLVCSFNSETTVCAAVRFGNVLGSSGSVLPLFQQQIRAGGPITITHPEMERYFMDIREAAALVVQASCRATGGEVFVLDMGKPVRIVDLAERLIRFAGLEPYQDIPIEFIGTRPGEKLQESLVYSDEQLTDSQHPKIRFARQDPQPADLLTEAVSEMENAVARGDGEALLTTLEKLLPGYKASEFAWKAVSARERDEPGDDQTQAHSAAQR